MSFKYSLIVSQFYHSRHYFIVEMTEDFLEKAKTFTLDLFEYKRDVNPNRKKSADCLGDLTYFTTTEIRSRYNVNDAGDLYFIQTNSINECMAEIQKYQEYSLMQGKGLKAKERRIIGKEIEEHHSLNEVYKIVTKHFKLV